MPDDQYSIRGESRTSTVSFKITPTMKEELDKMPELQRKRLTLKILKDIDFAIYIAKYNSPIPDDESFLGENNTELTL